MTTLTFARRFTVFSLLALPLAASAAVTDAASEDVGLYAASAFQVTTGQCGDCQVSKQARWYFEKETIAAPKQSGRLPPLVWLGSNKTVNGAKLSADGKSITQDGSVMPFSIVPKLATNLSYYNADTTAFFAKRPIRARGEVVTAADGSKSFVARTIWPQDFTV